MNLGLAGEKATMSDREAAQGEGAGAAASIVRHGYLSITDITDRGMIDLQIAEPETALVEVVSEALGAVLPADAHHSSSNGSLTILGRGPGHWVISCPASETARWTGRLETAIAGNLAMVTSIGEGYSILRLRGDAAGGALLRAVSSSQRATWPDSERGTYRSKPRLPASMAWIMISAPASRVWDTAP